MTNYPFQSLEEFNDVSVKNEVRLKKENGENVEQLLHDFSKVNRDNSRTMMQWNQTDYAGFSKERPDRKSTRLNSSHVSISYAVFCLKKKKVIYRFNFNFC